MVRLRTIEEAVNVRGVVDFLINVSKFVTKNKNEREKERETFKLAGENAGVITCLWRTQSSPSTISKPLPNIGSLSFLNTVGFPQLLPITPADIFFRNSGSAMYRNGSVPNQYINTFPTRNKKH